MSSISLGFDNEGKFTITQSQKKNKGRNKGESLLELPSSFTVVDIVRTVCYKLMMT